MKTVEFLFGDDITSIWSSKRRLRAYARVGRELFMQRVVIYSSAIILAGAYYDPYIAAYFFAMVALCEAFDMHAFRGILLRKTWRPKDVRSSMILLYLGTLFSSITISLFCISVAKQQGLGGGHFLPLFLLVSASIFAAMNNHHFLPVLGLRLSIYILTILYIPIRDVWIAMPPLSSEIWLNLLTVLFVLGFIMELARSFLVGYSQYLSSRKELEEEHKRTLAAYEAKTRFLATVSHELRTPLTSIAGAFDLINSGMLGQPPQKMERLLEIASRNSVRLKDLVDDLLFLQSSDSGKAEFNFQTVDLTALAHEVTERFQPFAQKAGVSVEVSATEGEFLVRADTKRLDQVLTNLLSNAAKFSDKNGKVTIALDARSDTIVLSVGDEGIGIPPGSEELVFAEFVQLDCHDDRKFDGTGLGLSISRRIVDAHNGKISYKSALGEGTTFFVELERAKASPCAAVDQAA